MANQEPVQNEKTMIIWGAFGCLPDLFGSFCNWFNPWKILRSSNSGNCYDEAGKEILSREGSKAMSKSDMERYHNELRSRCG